MAKQVVAGMEYRMSADAAKLLTELERVRKETTKMRKGVESAQKRINYAFNKIRRAAQVVASAFIITALVKRLGSLATAAERAEERVVLLQARMEQFGRSSDAFARTYQLAQRLGVGLNVVGDGMTRLLIATRSLGSTVEEVENVQRNIVLLGRAGGTSAEEMRGALIQLTQGMASGRLQGEELRSTLENLPLVAMEIASQLDIDIGKIREFAAAGKIGAQVIVDALQEVNVAVEELPETFSMTTSRIATEWELLLATMGKKFDTSGIGNYLSAILLQSRVNLGDYTAFTNEQLSKMYSEETDLEKGRLIMAEINRRKAVEEKINEANRVRLALMTAEEKLAMNLAKFRSLSVQGKFEDPGDFESLTRKVNKLKDWNPWDQAATIKRIGNEQRTKELKREFEELWAEFEQIAKDEDFLGEYFKMKLPKVANIGFTRMEAMADQAARNIQDAFADFLFDPFENGVKGMLKSFIDAIRRMIAEQAALSLFGPTTGFGKFFKGLFDGKAVGGNVSGGKTYLVGEQGPELFTAPSGGGFITPNHELVGVGGAVEINYSIDARGADEATIIAKMIPLLDRTVDATKNSIRQEWMEGRFL